MKTKKSQIEMVLKKIPTGYYFGKNISVTLDETSSDSYCNLDGPRIVISLTRIVSVLDKINENYSEEVIEKILRTVVYHEVSHALLTPICIFDSINEVVDGLKSISNSYYTGSDLTDIVNIVEDERIERITKDYFKGINYKWLVEISNPHTIEEETNIVNLWFYFIRLNELPSYINESFEISFLRDQRDLMIHASVGKFDRNCRNYITKISWNFEYFKNLVLKKNKNSQVDQNSSNEGCPASQSDGIGTTSDTTSDDKKSASPCPDTDDKDTLPEFSCLQDLLDYESSLETRKVLTTAFREVVDVEYCCTDKSISRKIQEVLKISNKVTAKSSGATNSYSGVFNPRNAAREDCKYFLHDNSTGSAKLFNKIKLNLFIDRSNSFSRSESAVNIILKSLFDLKRINPRFSFSLVTIGVGETVCDLDHFSRFICYDGTFLDKEIFSIFNKVQDSRASNINLVLIDGYAWWSRSYSTETDYIKNIGAFNYRNTTIITDESNHESISKYAPLAHEIVCSKDDYPRLLVDNVVKSLQKMIIAFG